MDNDEIIEQQNAYYMAGYPSRRSERKMNKDDLQLEQLMKELMMKKLVVNEAEEYVSKYQGYGLTPHKGSAVFEAMVDCYIYSARLREKEKLELLGIIQSKDKIIAELEAQIDQLQKINNDQKETLKKVRVALIQERTANLMNYGKGGVEMFDNIFEIISKSVSN